MHLGKKRESTGANSGWTGLIEEPDENVLVLDQYPPDAIYSNGAPYFLGIANVTNGIKGSGAQGTIPQVAMPGTVVFLYVPPPAGTVIWVR
jgi:hypothetical protein